MSDCYLKIIEAIFIFFKDPKFFIYNLTVFSKFMDHINIIILFLLTSLILFSCTLCYLYLVSFKMNL